MVNNISQEVGIGQTYMRVTFVCVIKPSQSVEESWLYLKFWEQGFVVVIGTNIFFTKLELFVADCYEPASAYKGTVQRK